MSETSIWKRPLGRKFLLWVAGICIAVVVAIAAYPYATSAIIWSAHRTVAYRGSSIALPFRWVYDSSSSPLTVEKPSWNLPLNSSLSIDETYWKPADAELHINKRKELDHLIHTQHPIGTAPDTIAPAQGVALLCAEDSYPWGIDLRCMSDDAAWLFNFSGQRDDLPDARAIVDYVLNHRHEFK